MPLFFRFIAIHLSALALITMVNMAAPAMAQSLDTDPTVGQQTGTVNTTQTAQPQRTPFKLKATESYTLPPDMYGQWTVVATLLKTNMPQAINPRIYDVWQLNQASDKVTLSNPNTGAFAAITVDDVEGNTATFHHRVVMKPGKQYLIERPTVTVNGNQMLGTTTQTYVITDRNGQVKKVYTALFRINAQKLGKSRVAFGEMGGPDLEIEDIQPIGRATQTSPETVDSSLFSIP
jgi:hypothetical protein